MIQSDHVAIRTAQELISVGTLVSNRAVCCQKAEGIPLHCVGGWAILFFFSQLIPHVRIFILDSTSFSLECPMCRCQMVHFGHGSKNYTWSELLPDMLGMVFHMRQWKISQCVRPIIKNACRIWISGNIFLAGLKYFCRGSAYDSLVHEALLMHFMIPHSFQIHSCAWVEKVLNRPESDQVIICFA